MPRHDAMGNAQGIRGVLPPDLAQGRAGVPMVAGAGESGALPIGGQRNRPIQLPFNGTLSSDERRMLEQFAFEDF